MASTSPPPACSPSRSGRTRSPTIWPTAATPGYKADRTAQREFGELLLANRANGATIGTQSTAVQVDNIETDFSPKPSRDTGEPLDFAITGEGFFGVRTAQGVRYTRNGQFTVSPQGLLVTASGDPVLGRGGRTVRVGDDGRVDPRALEVVRLDNPRKEGDNLVTGTPRARPAPDRSGPARWRPRARTRRDPWWT